MMWVDAVLDSKSTISRAEVMDKFRCSAASATSTLSKYAHEDFNGRNVRYDFSSKALEAREGFERVIALELSNDGIFQFINVMVEATPSVRAITL